MAAQIDKKEVTSETNSTLWDSIYHTITSKPIVPPFMPPLIRLAKDGKQSFLLGTFKTLKFSEIPQIINMLIDRNQVVSFERILDAPALPPSSGYKEIMALAKEHGLAGEDCGANEFNTLSTEHQKTIREFVKSYFRACNIRDEPDLSQMDALDVFHIIIRAIQYSNMNAQLKELFRKKTSNVLCIATPDSSPIPIDMDEEDSPEAFFMRSYLEADFLLNLAPGTFFDDAFCFTLSASESELVAKQNQAWIPSIKHHHQIQNDPMFVIDSAYLLGKRGLLQLLLEEGYVLHQIGIDGVSRPIVISKAGMPLGLSSQVETKSLKETDTHMPAALTFSGYPKDLVSRNIVHLPSLMFVLKKCTLKKDGDIVPTPELALRRAAAIGKLDVIQELLKLVKDIDINQPGPDSGKTAIMYAKEYDRKEMVEFLRKAGAKYGEGLEGSRSSFDTFPQLRR